MYNQQVNQTMYQNPNYGGYPPYYGQQPQVKPVKPIGGTLTPEELNLLRSRINPQFNIKPTDEEQAAGMCNHHYDDGNSSVQMHNDGTGTCLRCGTVINFNDSLTAEDAELLTKRFVNMQEIIKYSNFTMPVEAVRAVYGNTIPFNRKMGKLYGVVCSEIDKLTNPIGMNYNMSQMNGSMVYNVLNGGAMNPAMMNQGYNPYAQPQMQPGMPMQGFQPAYQQQQYMGAMPQQAGPIDGGYNPLYAQPQQQSQMQPAYNPQQQAAPSGAQYQPQNAQPQQQQGEQTVKTSQV
jgi:hypothetical protein